jgi:hypothetical protein
MRGELKNNTRVSVKDKFTALENLKYIRDINSAWDTVRKNIKISAKNQFLWIDVLWFLDWLGRAKIGWSKKAG